MNQIIIITAFFLAYFMVSGLATTNILRLTSGNTLPVLSSKCVCDSCGKKITPFFQLPIISFISDSIVKSIYPFSYIFTYQKISDILITINSEGI